MQRFAVGAFCTLAAFPLLVGVVSGYQSASFKEKIVFVRADPSRGVVSTQAIAAFDQNTGAQTSGHAGPQFADISPPRSKKKLYLCVPILPVELFRRKRSLRSIRTPAHKLAGTLALSSRMSRTVMSEEMKLP